MRRLTPLYFGAYCRFRPIVVEIICIAAIKATVRLPRRLLFIRPSMKGLRPFPQYQLSRFSPWNEKFRSQQGRYVWTWIQVLSGAQAHAVSVLSSGAPDYTLYSARIRHHGYQQMFPFLKRDALSRENKFLRIMYGKPSVIILRARHSDISGPLLILPDRKDTGQHKASVLTNGPCLVFTTFQPWTDPLLPRP